MTFTLTDLAGDRILVSGADVRGVTGEQILDAGEWNFLKRQDELAKAHDRFDAKVEDFFAELNEAIEEVENAHRVELDPLLFVVEQEGEEASAGKAERVRQLQPSTVILRAISTGHSNRLIWVKDELVVTAGPVSVPAAPVVDAPVEDEVVTSDPTAPVAGE